MNKIKSWIKNNSEYLGGLLLATVPAVLFISLFAFNSLSMQEGWYQIYAKWVNNGLLPYKDFHLVVTPFSLMIYSLIYKVFGPNLYSFHFMGLLSKTILLGCAYHLFSYVFPKKYAAFSVLFGAIILVSIIYDNGILTYNDIIITISILDVILFYKFVNCLENNDKNALKFTIILGLMLGITMLFKQTFGVLMLFSTSVLMFLFCQKLRDIKEAFRYISVSIVSFLMVLCGFLLFAQWKHMLIPFINDTFLKSTSAKGNLLQMLFLHFSSIPSRNLLWIFYVSIFLIVAMYFLTKRYGVSGVNTKNVPNAVFYPVSLITAVAGIYIGYFCVKTGVISNVLMKTVSINMFFVDLGVFPIIFVTVAAFFLFCKFLSEKEYNSQFGKYFILFAYTFVFSYSWSISTSLPNLHTFNYVLLMACLLSYNTKFNNIKNGFLYLFICFCMFLGATMKTISPCLWHSWQSASIVDNLKESENIPVLKGLKIPKNEIEIYDKVRAISDKYTTPDDKIFVYMNNQLFYYLLDREPITGNVSNYWDVCSDEMAESDAKILQNNPPKLIVYMQFPMSIIGMHESIFREGKHAKQRLIDKQILNMLAKNEYKEVAVFNAFIPNYEKYFTDKNKLNEYLLLKNRLNKIVATMVYKNEQDELNQYDRKYEYDDVSEKLRDMESEIAIKERFKIKRTTIPNGYTMKVLVRSDVYNSKN